MGKALEILIYTHYSSLVLSKLVLVIQDVATLLYKGIDAKQGIERLFFRVNLRDFPLFEMIFCISLVCIRHL